MKQAFYSGHSSPIISNQQGLHPDLYALVKKHQMNPDKRPINKEQQQQFEKVKIWQQNHELNQFILDTGCGTGESSQQLAKMFPDYCVIGIDQSSSRLGNLEQKCSEYANLKLVHARLEEFWLQSLKTGWLPSKQFMFYPNPWPKKKHLQRRWHGHAIFPVITQVTANIELRTNWKIYANEFSKALHFLGFNPVTTVIQTDQYISPFEKKYSISGHTLYQVVNKNIDNG